MPQICGMCETTILGHVGVMEDREDETNIVCLQIYVVT